MQDLESLLDHLPPDVSTLGRQVVDHIARHKALSGRVMKGWRSVNFRHQRAGLVCAVFPSPEKVSIYFEHGSMLRAPAGLLRGDHLKKGRYIMLLPGDDVPAEPIDVLILEAIALFA